MWGWQWFVGMAQLMHVGMATISGDGTAYAHVPCVRLTQQATRHTTAAATRSKSASETQAMSCTQSYTATALICNCCYMQLLLYATAVIRSCCHVQTCMRATSRAHTGTWWSSLLKGLSSTLSEPRSPIGTCRNQVTFACHTQIACHTAIPGTYIMASCVLYSLKVSRALVFCVNGSMNSCFLGKM